MKTILRFLTALTLSLLASSCLNDELRTDEAGLVQREYHVKVGDDTRASLGDGLYPCWDPGDSVSVYDPIAGEARIFTVISVDGSSAVISGTISAGEFPFSAVYPASAAGQWHSASECTISIPPVQRIPDGRDVSPYALVSRALAEDPSQGIVFHNSVSLLKFRPGHSDVDEVSFSLRKGDSVTDYVASCPQGFSTDRWYYLAVAPDTYTGGVSVKSVTLSGECFCRSSDTALEAAAGRILSLGTLSGGERTVLYNVLSESSFTDLASYMDAVPLFRNLTDESKSLLQLLSVLYLPWRNDHVRSVVYTHRSAGPKGEPVTLSAIMYVPESALNNGKTLKGIVIANHGSISADSERPTLVHDAQSIAVWKGYAVVLSDYCGFGADASHPQAYLNPDAAARGSFDACLAAMQILKDMGVRYGTEMYNIGYSQGGFNGMANIRYLSEHPELGFKFKKSFLGGGPYDIRQTWTDYLSGSYPKAAVFAPLTLCSFNECEGLDIPYDRMFKGALLADYDRWILSKKYSMTQIGAYLKTSDIRSMVTDEVIDPDSGINAAIMAICDRYSLTGGWKPAPGSVIRIYHSTQDDIVPYSNFTSMKKFLGENAADCTVTYKDGAYGDHTNAAVTWATDLVMNW